MAARQLKTRVVNVRMTKAERARLQAIADHYGMPAAAVVRLLLREAESALLAVGQRDPA